jgi:hypothetical protein
MPRIGNEADLRKTYTRSELSFLKTMLQLNGDQVCP